MNIGMISARYRRLTPSKTALVDTIQGRRLSFAELDEQVRRTANGLLALGAQRGDRVAVLAGNTAEHMIVFLACARAGLVNQSMNWRLAPAELQRIVVDSEPAVVIVQDRFAELANALKESAASARAWLSFGPDSDGSFERLLADASSGELELDRPVHEDDPNYILYTGGTTGESKGVLHSHRTTFHAIVNNTAGEIITPNDVYMLTGQMFHSAAILALSFLAHGCTIVMMDFDPKRAMELIHRERVTNFIGITTMINWMIAVEDFERYDTSSIRHIMYGGGPLPAAVVRQAIGKFNCNMLGCFGQTEGNTMTFLNYAAHTDALKGIHPERLNSCGREAFLTTIEIRDEAGRTIPPGSKDIGEIHVRSAANMIGYWRRPDLTAKTLVDGWMKTGDLAWWDEERHVFIVDRAKDMIISGGENIYSCQVEDAIHRHPAVLEAAVIGVPHDEWGEIVAAYVVLKPGMNASDQDIIEMARTHLASYQKPRLVRFVAELPKAPTGKILKRVLRETFHGGGPS
jgi:acyl-CoA synthetase (AMP-forming)/AMP-acid ligase II